MNRDYVSASQMKALDIKTIKSGIPADVLMENAGKKASQTALTMIKKPGKILSLCGKGNNGGDGFVCSRYLINKGFQVETVIFDDPEKMSDESKQNYKKIKVLDAKIYKFDLDFNKLNKKIQEADLIIDAIFGIGLSGKVRHPFDKIITSINQSKKTVLALDIPSGLDATSGKVLGNCVKADKTVTFAFAKIGFIKNDGPNFVGKVIVADIGITK